MPEPTFNGLPILTNPYLKPGEMYFTQTAVVVHEWAPEQWWKRLGRRVLRRPRPASGMELLRAAVSDA